MTTLPVTDSPDEAGSFTEEIDGITVGELEEV